MRDIDRLEQALKEIREADANCGAPDFLETRLRAAFRERHAPRPSFLARWWWAGAALASLLVAAAIWNSNRPAQPPAPVALRLPPALTPPPAEVKPPALPKVADLKRPRPKPRTAAPHPPTPSEPVNLEFTALPYAPPFDSYENGHVIRVRLPRQSIRGMGLEITGELSLLDRVPAQILMGQDGVARGIRLVRTSDMQ